MCDVKWYVYRHRRADTNDIFYIGLGSSKYYARAYTKYGRNKMWKNIVSKTKFSIEIVADKLIREDAKELEIFLISLYGRRDFKTGNLVNFTHGGDGISGLSKEGREQKRNKMLGKNNPNFGKKGEDSFHYGIKRSKETKQRISESLKGRKGSFNENHSLYGISGELHPLYKRTRTKEVIDKIRKTKTGLPNKAFEKLSKKELSEMFKNKGLGNKSKSRLVLDTDMGIFYNSAKEAAKYKSINYNTLIDYLKGKYTNKTSLVYV